MQNNPSQRALDDVIVTAGSTYLDIDAYACMVAMRQLLELLGRRAVACSAAACNYSICDYLRTEGECLTSLPDDFDADSAQYIIVDVSSPEYIRDCVPLERVIAVYDHHTGYEAYWQSRIGQNAQIEFIGAAATLIVREWQKAGLFDRMPRSTALLLIAAILDNTLNLTSAIVTDADREAFAALCQKEHIGDEWCAAYFSAVQDNVEADLRNALFHDVKRLPDHPVLPPRFAQLCVWDAQRSLRRLDEIRDWFGEQEDSWIMNIIDIKRRCSYFVCDDVSLQQVFAALFDVRFDRGVAKAPKSYLRKEIIKAIQQYRLS